MNQIMFDGPWAPINEAHADQGNIKARFTCIKSKYSNQRRRSVDNVEAYDIKPVDKFVCENSSNSSLTMLDLSYSTISVIEKNSFKNFINLNYLSLAYNKMPTFTKPMFAGLGNLKVLIISHNLISFLENSTFDYLKQLETLDISKNPLLGYCFKNFPKDLFSPLVNLKQLYLQGNANVTFDQYPNQALKLLKRLNILGVDGLNNSSFNTDLKFLNNLIWIQIGLYGTKCSIKNFQDDFFENTPYLTNLKVWETQGIVLPPNLKHLHAFRFTQFGLILLFQEIRNKSSLYKVDFSSSYTPEWGQGVLPSTVTYANFGANYCRNLTKRFFENNTVLTNLRINDNLLAEVIAADQKGDIFSTLDKLELLDLAENIIYELPFPIMSKLQNLKIIDLSTNKISTLNVSLANCSRLTYIDLSRNSISWITRNTLDDLDTIAANHTIYLDLTFNPLPCTCKGLPIIFWLAHTNVYLLSKDFLTCSDEDNNYIKMGNAEKMLKTLQIHCVSKELTLFICLFSAVCIALVVLLLTMYRFRWRLRYLRTVAIGKLLGFESTLPNNLRYKYDAYILYTDETRSFVLQDCVQELEVNRGHRLCIEERDFMPGTYTVSAIVSAVQNSAKTVPVVTPEFYDGEYAEYGLKMAVMEEIFSRRSVLHLCIYKPVSADDMSRDLLSVLRKNRFTEFPADDEMTPEARLTFWNQMSRSISHNPAED
ncbi:toll-like receptor 4 [Physella acuta]|uniref:toll-like receptor 4 n=1 Tax=Physella acuta TaxID=109671 RepID=UPI0027DAB872|nr:toll-like receptor 4 [Physella acuta]